MCDVTDFDVTAAPCAAVGLFYVPHTVSFVPLRDDHGDAPRLCKGCLKRLGRGGVALTPLECLEEMHAIVADGYRAMRGFRELPYAERAQAADNVVEAVNAVQAFVIAAASLYPAEPEILRAGDAAAAFTEDATAVLAGNPHAN